MVPTILDISGVPQAEWPPFFDGRSLLSEWQSGAAPDDGIQREVMNIEYWGLATVPAGVFTKHYTNNSYKSLRIVDEQQGWLFNRWCTSNQTELYNTIDDPYELTNLAISPTQDTQWLIDRLSGLLLVTKSCGQETCRKPWQVLSSKAGANFSSLAQAMDAEYDAFFASLPAFGFQGCLPYQLVANEGPYYPPESAELGQQYREITTDYSFWLTNGSAAAGPVGLYGNVDQRYMGIKELRQSARYVTDTEIGYPTQECRAPDYCGEVTDDV